MCFFPYFKFEQNFHPNELFHLILTFKKLYPLCRSFFVFVLFCFCVFQKPFEKRAAGRHSHKIKNKAWEVLMIRMEGKKGACLLQTRTYKKRVRNGMSAYTNTAITGDVR